jgi:hypothetical protein
MISKGAMIVQQQFLMYPLSCKAYNALLAYLWVARICVTLGCAWWWTMWVIPVQNLSFYRHCFGIFMGGLV